MRFNRKEHCRFVQWLDRTAEKNPVLWLPCIILLAIILGLSGLVSDVKTVASRHNRTIVPSRHNEVVIIKKPFALRAVAVALVFALIGAFVPEVSEIITFSVYAEEINNSNFDLYMYIADDILYDRSDDTNQYINVANHTMNYYFNEFIPMAKIWENSITPEFENSVRTWETTNLVLSPGDIGKKAIDERGYYLTILLTLMNCSYENDTIIDKLNNSNVKTSKAIYKYFADFFKEYTNGDLKDFINNNNFTEEQKEKLMDAQKEWLKEAKIVKNYETIDEIMDIISAADSIENNLEAFCNYCQVSQICDEWKSIVEYMSNNCDPKNWAFCSALEELKAYFSSDDWFDTALIMLRNEGVNSFASWGIKKSVSELTKIIIKKFPALSGINIGASLGKTMSNFLFGTDKTVEEYHICKAYCEILELIKGAYKNVENSYINNRTAKNASVFINYVNIYFTALDVGNDYGLEFADVLCNGGIVNKIIYSQAQYDNFVKNHDSFKEYIAWARETVMISWVKNLYYDYPDLYENYAPVVLKDHKDWIEITRIEFEKDSVEWGFEDVEFNGVGYTVFPSEANGNEILIESSDESIASIDNYGNIKIFGTGECQFKVSSAYNEDIFDVLEVSVVEGHGADSIALPDIIPIFPHYENEFSYTIENNEVTVTGYKGSFANVVIPDTISGMPVTTIGKNAFFGNKSIMSVSFPESLLSIESRAFDSCTGISSIYLPKGIKSLGQEAFGNTEISEVFIPKSLEICNCDVATNGNVYWSSGPFSGCSKIKSVIFEDGIAKIIPHLFSKCSGIENLGRLFATFCNCPQST